MSRALVKPAKKIPRDVLKRILTHRKALAWQAKDERTNPASSHQPWYEFTIIELLPAVLEPGINDTVTHKKAWIQ